MSEQLHVCVVGYGYWGPKLVRNFLAAGAKVCIHDADIARLVQAERDFPNLELAPRWEGALTADAVVIATPPVTHFNLALQALNAGKHVLVEKPLCFTPLQARHLQFVAERKNVTLMCDHTFLYHPAVRRLKHAIRHNELGDLQCFTSSRVNLGLVQKDCSVLWDLAVHDVSILLHLIDERPVSVSASGRNDAAVLSLQYQSGLFAHIDVSWRSPVKVRRMMLAGDSAAVWDDTNVAEPLKIYDSGIDKVADQTSYRSGAILSPKLDSKEALLSMTEDFLHCCRTGATPVSSLALARDVVYVLARAHESLNSAPVKLEF